MTNNDPTPFPELNTVLMEHLTSVQAILGQKFIANYLQGSFAIGDADVHSDVDFLVVISANLTPTEVDAINAIHARIFQMNAHWAQHLEGSYFPTDLLKKADSARTPIYYLDNGATKLELSDHDNTLVVRWVVREHGIPLAGPPPDTLVDPVPPDDLRQEVRQTMREWGQEILSSRYSIGSRWAQPFVVLSYCRMLHTLESGRIRSKKASGQWAVQNLAPQWTSLIQQALDDRPDPWGRVHQSADPHDQQHTLDFIRYALLRTE